MSRKGTMLSARFTPEEVDVLRQRAGRQGITLSEFIRRSLRGYTRSVGYDRETRIGWSSDGVQYTMYKTCGSLLGGFHCCREIGHDGPHEVNGFRWAS